MFVILTPNWDVLGIETNIEMQCTGDEWGGVGSGLLDHRRIASSEQNVARQG